MTHGNWALLASKIIIRREIYGTVRKSSKLNLGFLQCGFFGL